MLHFIQLGSFFSTLVLQRLRAHCIDLGPFQISGPITLHGDMWRGIIEVENPSSGTDVDLFFMCNDCFSSRPGGSCYEEKEDDTYTPSPKPNLRRRFGDAFDWRKPDAEVCDCWSATSLNVKQGRFGQVNGYVFIIGKIDLDLYGNVLEIEGGTDDLQGASGTFTITNFDFDCSRISFTAKVSACL